MMRLCEMAWLAAIAACGFPRPADVVGDDVGGGSDAGQDADSIKCLGTFVNICVKTPAQQLVISEPTVIDTASSPMCTPVISDGDYCVIAATDITTFMPVRATGIRPLVLFASGTIITGAVIDVGSHRDNPPEIGAGADPSSCAPGALPDVAGVTAGGGAGGSFTGVGGSGGAGGTVAGGVAGAATSSVSVLRGGCAGQTGGTVGDAGLKGHGGGAVYFVAGNTILLRGAVAAGGEGGGGAGGGPDGGGGGGGGAGGMIVLDAPQVTASNSILANGGGGGEGSSPFLGMKGHPGQDSISVLAAPGGDTGDDFGGAGGTGAAGIAAGGGKPGATGMDTGEGNAGGGGGGGGAGLIKAPTTASLGGSVSPPSTP
jgi:hypothetical protein